MTDTSYTPQVGNPMDTPWQSLAEPERDAREAPFMEASRGLAFRELFAEGGLAERTFGFIAADDARARRAQQYRVFGLDDDAPLSAEEANEQFGVQGRLSFDRPIDPSIAAWRQSLAHRDAFRDEVVRNADVNWWEAMGATMAGSILDPVGLPLWLLPEVGVGNALRSAAAAGRMARLGEAGIGATIGALEGVAGGLAYEGANLWLSRAGDTDYSLGQAAANVVLGGLLGAGVGGVGGWWESRAGRRAHAPLVVEALPENSRYGAFAEALDAVVEDRPVDVTAGLVREARAGRLSVDAASERQSIGLDVERRAAPMTTGRWAEMGDDARLEWVAADQLASERRLLASLEATGFKPDQEGRMVTEDGWRTRDGVAAHIDETRARIVALEGVIQSGDLKSDVGVRALAGIDRREPTAARQIIDAVADWSEKGRAFDHPLKADASARAPRPTAFEKPKVAKGEKAAPRGQPYADPEVAALAADTEQMVVRAGLDVEASPRTPQRLADAIAAARSCLAA